MVAKDANCIKQLTALFNLIMEITDGVYTVLEDSSKLDAYHKMADPTANISTSTSNFRDRLYMAAYIVDNTLADIFYTALGAVSGLGSSSVQLHPDGSIIFTTEHLKCAKTQTIEAHTPTELIKEGLYMGLLITTDAVSVGKLAVDIGAGAREIQTKQYKDTYQAEEAL
jgi:hypothetical protein